MSLPVRGAWIEINASAQSSIADWSLPVRGAWIEISSVILFAPVSARRSP